MLVKTLTLATLAGLVSAKTITESRYSAYSRTLGKALKYTKASERYPASALRRRTAAPVTAFHTAKLETVKTVANETEFEYASDDGESFSIVVNINGDDLYLIFDTGSSDTWTPAPDFECLTGTTQADCGFGVIFDGTVEDSTIPGEFFFIEYGDGEEAYGPLSVSNRRSSLERSSMLIRQSTVPVSVRRWPDHQQARDVLCE